jgi:hypothetical protein
MGPHAGVDSNLTWSQSRLSSQRIPIIMMNYKEKEAKLGWKLLLVGDTLLSFMSG